MGGIVDLGWIAWNYAHSVLPLWAQILIATVVLAFFARGAWSNRATDIARRTLKRAARERGQAREALESEALAAVRAHPQGLVMVADTALAAGRNHLAQAALAHLRASRSLQVEVRRIERALEGPMPGSAFEAVILVERLLEQGQKDLARDRLQKCRARWPADADLAALAAQIGEAASLGSGPIPHTQAALSDEVPSATDSPPLVRAPRENS